MRVFFAQAQPKQFLIWLMQCGLLQGPEDDAGQAHRKHWPNLPDCVCLCVCVCVRFLCVLHLMRIKLSLLCGIIGIFDICLAFWRPFLCSRRNVPHSRSAGAKWLLSCQAASFAIWFPSSVLRVLCYCEPQSELSYRPRADPVADPDSDPRPRTELPSARGIVN